MGFFQDWRLETVRPPWGQRKSIYDHIRFNHASTSLPDEELVWRKGEIRWIAGATDGVSGHHTKSSDPKQRVFRIIELLRNLLRKASNGNLESLYDRIVSESVLTLADRVIKELEDPKNSFNKQRLRETGRYFAACAPHREAVKFGIVLLNIAGSSSELELLRVLGGNDEFTLYSAVAISRVASNPEQELWELAKRVHGWGRIQIVERLKATANPEIQSWFLREGFRNDVMNEYLAAICARSGSLQTALARQPVDMPLLDGAADIIRALISGGPADGIDDYEHAGETCELFVNEVWSRQGLRLKHFLTIASLREFLSSPTGWDSRQKLGWSAPRRQNVQALCEDIFARDAWRQQVATSLSSDDEDVFREADAAAERLSIDTWNEHFARVRLAPLTSPFWYRLMRQTDESRIEEVLEFAESAIPVERISTGPADEVGLGHGFGPHVVLDWILQELPRFAGKGWRLVDTGLRSPVVRNRNFAISALAAWPKETWPPEALLEIHKAMDSEPDDKIRSRLSDLLAKTSRGAH